MTKVQASWLKSINDLNDVPEEQLQWLIANSRQVIISAGDFVLKPGEPLNCTSIVLSGKARIYRIQNGDMLEVLLLEPGDITGYLPFSRGTTASLYVQAIADTELLNFPIEEMNAMIHTQFELTRALVHVMTTRVRESTSQQQQYDKMLALGKLSAGLAHELNNPAAALVRGSAVLKAHLHLSPANMKTIFDLRLEPACLPLVTEKISAILQRKRDTPLTIMTRSAQEDELTEWLEQFDIDNPAEKAENLVEYSISTADLDIFRNSLPIESLSPLINWLNSMLITDKLVTDIEEASTRIGNLVQSVKTFTHMDQGHDKQLTDLHSGIENTLAMLNYRLKKGNISLIKNFSPDMPPVMAMIGELNQVWTNLIDNALDAMEEQQRGSLELTTAFDSDFCEVTITDSGPGIPAAIVSNIFDPFFTTKDVGKGTGLGLDVVNRIIRQHRGSVKVDTTPGRTSFIICLPLTH